MWKFACALLLASLDQGIFSDLAGRVSIQAPTWSLPDAPVSLRIDDQHRILTLWRGSVALIAYPIIATPSALASLSRSPSREDVLLLMSKADGDEARGLLNVPFSVQWGPPPKHEGLRLARPWPSPRPPAPPIRSVMRRWRKPRRPSGKRSRNGWPS